jgi:hypothetical protein
MVFYSFTGNDIRYLALTDKTDKKDLKAIRDEFWHVG